MKLKNLFALLILTVVLSSCGARYNNPDELLVPVIRAIQNDNVNRLQGMLPGINEVNEVYASNKQLLGFTYYNKYTRSYRLGSLKGFLHSDLDIIRRMSQESDLNWDQVALGNVAKEDVIEEGKHYTKITANLLFPGKAPYQLSYNAINTNGKWYLLNNVYLQMQPKQ